ncbi:NADH-quinone oxidoreductase subunit N [Pseudonocardia sp. WMMC193]|uniref:NADH-quinone oxidoreductase subunit N n=1 Tax=Pseudonocardia sp. WMMC193 TaxID=2911965 RepID=UPI001F415186|nr:NADH-quinone oxidoreductase subunit N [Pseudonocardia sp. WMMC193]MCF7552678.1 NADH-quinone oxidoreductase subunit N [Pseudonocardia sp. WMMC193]
MNTGMNEDPLALLPELFLLGGAVVGLLLGSWLPRRRQGAVRWLATLAAAAGLLATLARPAAGPVFADAYLVDTATTSVRVIVLVAVPAVLWLAADAVAGHRRETEFAVLVQLGGLGAVVLAGANDLLLLFAAFLLASVPLYALVGWAADARATEAAMKYYLTGAFSGVAMITGIALLYGAGGATGYPALREGLAAGPAAVAGVGVVALLVGLAFKAGAVPAQFWVPDVVDGTPAPVAAVVTTLPKIGALVAAYRLVVQALPAGVVPWPVLLAVLAAASMTLGNLAAFTQDSLQRLLAYSTVSQVGYLLMAVAVAGVPEALPGLLFYLAGYAVTNVGAFAVLAALPGLRAVADARGLARAHPVLTGALVVCLLGLVGTPPTAVFLGKLALFTAAVDGGMAWLTVFAVVNTVASVFYYLRWIAAAFRTGEGSVRRLARRPAAVAVASAVGSVLLGVAGGLVLPLLIG